MYFYFHKLLIRSWCYTFFVRSW